MREIRNAVNNDTRLFTYINSIMRSYWTLHQFHCSHTVSHMIISTNLFLHRSYKSVDGRTTPLLCGTNPSTPQPSSPDTPHFHQLHEYNSVASPSSPVSPEMLMLSGLHTPGSRDSYRLLSNEDTRCSTPDTCEEMVGPWCRSANMVIKYVHFTFSVQ